MQCMVLEQFNAPLVLREREIPAPGPQDAIVKMGACGLCGTDLKLWRGNHPALKQLPFVPGHEIAGEVVEVGTSVAKDLIGKHAVIYCYLSCGKCEFCRAGSEILCPNVTGQIGFNLDGGFAEYIKVPAANLFCVSPEIPFEEAAIVTDAIATPYRAITTKARLREGETLIVIGAGGLGVHAIQIARVFGARVIAVDISQSALALATTVGADYTFQTSKSDPRADILDLSHGGVDVVMDFVAKPVTQQLGLSLLKPGGRFISIAYAADNTLEINSQMLVSRELQLYGSRSCGRRDLQETIDLITQRKIKPIIASRYPLRDANLALGKLQQGDTVGRMVLMPQ